MRVLVLGCLGLGVWGMWSGCGADDDAPPYTASSDASVSADASDDDASSGPVMPAGCPVTPPTQCSSPALRYADVEPIFVKHCVSCHDGMHGQWPLTSYQHIADWFGEVRARMIDCTMPPLPERSNMQLSERLEILNWIRCGFPR